MRKQRFCGKSRWLVAATGSRRVQAPSAPVAEAARLRAAGASDIRTARILANAATGQASGRRASDAQTARILANAATGQVIRIAHAWPQSLMRSASHDNHNACLCACVGSHRGPCCLGERVDCQRVHS